MPGFFKIPTSWRVTKLYCPVGKVVELIPKGSSATNLPRSNGKTRRQAKEIDHKKAMIAAAFQPDQPHGGCFSFLLHQPLCKSTSNNVKSLSKRSKMSGSKRLSNYTQTPWTPCRNFMATHCTTTQSRPFSFVVWTAQKPIVLPMGILSSGFLRMSV